MIHYQVKLKLSLSQERKLDRWLYHLTAVWNWGIKKIEYEKDLGIYSSSLTFRDLLKGHGKKIGVPQDAICGTLSTAHRSWQRCFKNITRKPGLKGRRNKLNSIAFAHGTEIVKNRIHVPVLGKVRFHKQHIPDGYIGQMRLIKRASGWYVCLFIQSEPNKITKTSSERVGIDPGFESLLTLSNGERIKHPREYEKAEKRIGQAQRGQNRQLTARLHERVRNRRKDRNHKISHRLVSENEFIAFSADSHSSVAKKFGKSVTSSAHFQLRNMLAYKSRAGGRQYFEVSNRNSTKTCSNCGSLSGPSGISTLAVRQWRCGDCGSPHDRDVNAAVNTLIAALGGSVEVRLKSQSGIFNRQVEDPHSTGCGATLF